jgi:ABC-type uncharacterized transport system involved in gliding motility auxiliary subunit
VLLLNLAGARVHPRIDLTADRVYTLSPASRALLAALPDQLTIKAYLPKTLPPELAARARYTRDLLDEYRAAGGGAVHVETYDQAQPSDDAEACGIVETPVQVRRANKAIAARYRWGLCLWYDGKHRALVPSGRGADLEYELTALIKRISSKPRKIVFTTGHGERDLGDEYSFVRLALSEEHEVVTLDPSRGAIGDAAAVVIAGPRRPFDDAGRRAIEDFVRRGGSAIFLVDGRTEPDAPGGGRAIDSGLEPLLAGYGFAIEKRLAFDAQNAPGPVGAGEGALIANRPGFVEVTQTARGAGDDAANAPSKRLTPPAAVVFPFPSPVDLVGPLALPTAPAGADLMPLARTTARAWTEAGATRETDRGPLALGFAYRGPVDRGARPVRLVVIGDSAFAADRYMRLVRSFPIYAGGAQLLLDAVDWALEDASLAALRGNARRSRALVEVSPEQASAITWASAVGLPALFCAAGLLRWRVRRRRAAQQRFERRRAPTPAPSVALEARS